MAKGVLIMPESIEETIKVKHWMMARDLSFEEVYIPTIDGKKQLMIMSKFDWVNRILYTLTFGMKRESVNVF